MAFYDWNRDGKKDFAVKDKDTHPGDGDSAGERSSLVPLQEVIVVFLVSG